MKKAPEPGLIHPEWNDLNKLFHSNSLSRRRFVSGALGAVGTLAFWGLLSGSRSGAQIDPVTAGVGVADQATWRSTNKIKHVVILCQENRSFDHYFGRFASILGKAPNTAVGFDPSRLTYVNHSGGRWHPFHIQSFCDFDPDHGWNSSHAKWNSGKMNGWITGEPNEIPLAIGYFDISDHLYHVQLAQAFTIADHHFCSQIGPTLPNRLYLWTGTSGWNYLSPKNTNGLPYNNPSLTEPPPILTWPTMADSLQRAKLPWKCYSVADGSVPSTIGAFNPLIFFKQIQGDAVKLANATAEISEFFTDLAAGMLPAVSWIVTEATVSEHPPAPPDMGQLLAARIVRALMESTAWESTALFVTYDEGGGYFDHVPPSILEYVPSKLPKAHTAVGPAFRVPLIIVSPWAKAGTVFKGRTDHTSILQFIEHTFSTQGNPVRLPTISLGRRLLADLRGAFDFAQPPQRPSLPTPEQLFGLANETVLTLDVHRTAVECTTTLPRWLPPLLGVSSPTPFPTPTPIR